MSEEHVVNKTLDSINERIRKGKAVVLTAEEMTKAVAEMGKVEAAKEVDVVTTGTFSPMCSSGMLFNIGQRGEAMRVSQMTLNDVPAYSGLAAVDSLIGATEPALDDPLNKVYPGEFKYGGGHVIEDLVSGRTVHITASSYGTDCYPRRNLELDVKLEDLPFAQLFNPRNGYQNYNVAVNMNGRIIYTYMGPLKPGLRNANFATSGCLSPLFNDPYFRTIGLGTKIFLGGGVGWVLGPGTQHNPAPPRTERGLPTRPAGTMMVRGEMKGMNGRFLRGVSMLGYGCSLAVGLGIPIPVLNEEIAWYTGVSDEDIMMPVKDYGEDYPKGSPRVLGEVSFAELRSGEIELMGKKIQTVPLTSYTLSLEVAETLKSWILEQGFTLTAPQELLPSS
ncbi:homocysteine biosynthesis protein [Oceanidesulfovibrio indonesiensis]|nr:homocysteine biosynthesis protein [Oceanidesulfovibrio indonesiensis]